MPHHRQQNKAGGRHSHNGEILDLLQSYPPTSDRILAAYHEWQAHRPPRNIQAQIAQAYNRAHRTMPKTAEERAVKIILDNWSDTWIRHGQEQAGDVGPKSVFPDPATRIPVGRAVLTNPGEGWFAVDLDSNPFSAFHEHRVELTSGYPWTYTVGLLPYRTFQLASGELQHPQDRDHLYARCSVPARLWVFLHRDFDHHALDLQTQQSTRTQMLKSDVPALSYSTYTLLVQLRKHLQQYSTVYPSRVAEPRNASSRSR